MSTKTATPLFSWEERRAELTRALLVTLNLYPTSNDSEGMEAHISSLRTGLAEMIPGLEYADLVALHGLARLLFLTPGQVNQAVRFCQNRSEDFVRSLQNE